MRSFRALALAGIVLALQGQSAPTDLETGLSALADRHSAPNAPGCAIIVRDPRGTAVGRFGLSSIEHGVPVDMETVFHVGSIAKQVTAVAILMLEAEGKLSLDDPLTRLVPEMSATGANIRIRNLLEHTSGIRDYGELLLIAGGLDTAPVSRELLLDLLSRQRALNFEPGTRFSYSNSGYVLLALIVERASGQTLADFAAARLFAPLGMAHTRFLSDHAAIVPHRAQGYRRAGRDAWQRADYLSDAYGDGGLFTTAGDLMRWTENLESGRVGGERVVRRLAQSTTLADGSTVPWGLGLEVRSSARGPTLGHGGRDFGFQSYQLLYPAAHVAAIALCNGREIDANQIAGDAAALSLPAPAPVVAAAAAPAPGPGAAAVSNGDLQAFSGIWFSPVAQTIRRITFADGQLSWARGTGTRLEPTGPHGFRFANAPITVEFSDFIRDTPQTATVVNSGASVPTRTVYRRVAPAAADLAPYLGLYRSAETGTSYRVSRASDGGLTFQANPSFAFTAAPQFLDAFTVGEDVIVQFQRRGNRIPGLTVSTDRARNVRFDRIP